MRFTPRKVLAGIQTDTELKVCRKNLPAEGLWDSGARGHPLPSLDCMVLDASPGQQGSGEVRRPTVSSSPKVPQSSPLQKESKDEVSLGVKRDDEKEGSIRSCPVRPEASVVQGKALEGAI